MTGLWWAFGWGAGERRGPFELGRLRRSFDSRFALAQDDHDMWGAPLRMTKSEANGSAFGATLSKLQVLRLRSPAAHFAQDDRFVVDLRLGSWVRGAALSNWGVCAGPSTRASRLLRMTPCFVFGTFVLVLRLVALAQDDHVLLSWGEQAKHNVLTPTRSFLGVLR
jgi:hypothetical protein